MLELADIVRAIGAAYRRKHGSRILPSHLRAMRDIERCRTPALGGHLWACDRDCGHLRFRYHSCRNRSCPKCDSHRTRRWVETQRSRALACSTFLLTFTLPEEIRAVARSHQKTVYRILFDAAAASLLRLFADPKFLGGRPGVLAVLHTWTRALVFHPHVHMLVTAGGLSPDGTAWRGPRHPRFLVPGYVLSALFRKKVQRAFRRAGLLDQVPPEVWGKQWVVHLQHAGSGERVLEYLGRYVFRIALPNSRLQRFENGEVTFRYRENDSGKVRRCTLPAGEFLRRFLQHVLPRGFPKVRRYGLYAPSCKRDLERARSLLAARDPDPAPTNPPPTGTPDPPKERAPDDRCPACGLGRMRIIETLPAAREPP
jgi:hypothetical protein